MPTISAGKNSQVSSTQNTTNQFDNRLAATENARVVGAGGYLDESYYDGSVTNIDSSDRSQYAYSDQSVTNMDSADRRSYVDNSTTTVYSLDGKTVDSVVQATVATADRNAALLSGLQANQNSTLLAAAQIAADQSDADRSAAYNLASQSLLTVQTNTDALIDAATAEAEATRTFTTGFVRDFYESQQDSAERVSTDLMDTIRKLGFAALAALALRSVFRRA